MGLHRLSVPRRRLIHVIFHYFLGLFVKRFRSAHRCCRLHTPTLVHYRIQAHDAAHIGAQRLGRRKRPDRLQQFRRHIHVILRCDHCAGIRRRRLHDIVFLASVRGPPRVRLGLLRLCHTHWRFCFTCMLLPPFAAQDRRLTVRRRLFISTFHYWRGRYSR